MKERRVRKFFTGPPGGGKGTAAEALATSLMARHVIMSDLLKIERAKHTPRGNPTTLAQRIAKGMEVGGLVKDQDVFRVTRIHQEIFNDSGTLILDGFMRSVGQVDFMFDGHFLHSVTDRFVHIHIDTPDEECIERMLKRARPGETLDVIKDRLKHYHKVSKPGAERLHAYLRKDVDTYVAVEGHRPADEVLNQILVHVAA